MGWYIDEGLQRFKREWLGVHPGATVYSIGDQYHDTNPNNSQHAPDWGGSKPGDDKGEVDALDIMPGKGVTDKHLDDLFEGLIKSRDKRILYLIRRDKIVIPADGWHKQAYYGEYHGHVHISVNDNYDNDQSDWKWEKLVARKIEYKSLGADAKLPELMYGDADQNQDGWNHVGRAQALANWYDKKVADIDVDGVYGAKTAQKMKAIFGGDGKKITLHNMRTLHGI